MLGSQEQPGVIPRAVREVFQLVRSQMKDQDEWEFSVGMSYLEIYNEKVMVQCIGFLFLFIATLTCDSSRPDGSSKNTQVF